MDKFNVSLVCVADVEEKLLDVLLSQFGDEVFLSLPTFSHGTASGRRHHDCPLEHQPHRRQHPAS